MLTDEIEEIFRDRVGVKITHAVLFCSGGPLSELLFVLTAERRDGDGPAADVGELARLPPAGKLPRGG